MAAKYRYFDVIKELKMSGKANESICAVDINGNRPINLIDSIKQPAIWKYLSTWYLFNTYSILIILYLYFIRTYFFVFINLW